MTSKEILALRKRDKKINAWLETVKPGDIVSVRLNSTDTLTGRVYEAPDPRGMALCVNTTVLRHGNGYPGGTYELMEKSGEIEVFIINNETIPEISKKSGLSIEDLENVLNYDLQFGLTSKLYLVEKPLAQERTHLLPKKETAT